MARKVALNGTHLVEHVIRYIQQPKVQDLLEFRLLCCILPECRQVTIVGAFAFPRDGASGCVRWACLGLCGLGLLWRHERWRHAMVVVEKRMLIETVRLTELAC